MAGKSDVIKWLAHPFYHNTEHLPKDDIRRSGGFVIPHSFDFSVTLPAVEPDERELAILKRQYPNVDPDNPPWRDIKAALLASGVPPETVRNADSRYLVRMLSKLGKLNRRTVDGKPLTQRQKAVAKRREEVYKLADEGWNPGKIAAELLKRRRARKLTLPADVKITVDIVKQDIKRRKS